MRRGDEPPAPPAQVRAASPLRQPPRRRTPRASRRSRLPRGRRALVRSDVGSRALRRRRSPCSRPRRGQTAGACPAVRHSPRWGRGRSPRSLEIRRLPSVRRARCRSRGGAPWRVRSKEAARRRRSPTRSSNSMAIICTTCSRRRMGAAQCASRARRPARVAAMMPDDGMPTSVMPQAPAPPRAPQPVAAPPPAAAQSPPRRSVRTRAVTC